MPLKQSALITKDFERIGPRVAHKLADLHESTVLVTGGAGFVGSWLCELVSYLNEFHKAEIRLVVADRDHDLFAKRLPHIAADPRVQFIGGDIRSLTELPREVNYIIHAAATPDSRFHASSPFETMTTIAEGTACVLRAASRVSDLKKFVNISSSAVYAAPQQAVLIGESAPGLILSNSATSAYAEAKRYAEKVCAAARSEARIPVVNVRPFTFCGAYQNLDSPWALNNFINDALHQRSIRILGDGQTVRSLMYGADLASWLLTIALHGNSGQVFNVGSDQGESVVQMAGRVAACFNPVPDILTNTSLSPIMERSYLVPDISSARSQFGLDIFTPVDLAIARTIDWYRSTL